MHIGTHISAHTSTHTGTNMHATGTHASHFSARTYHYCKYLLRIKQQYKQHSASIVFLHSVELTEMICFCHSHSDNLLLLKNGMDVTEADKEANKGSTRGSRTGSLV